MQAPGSQNGFDNSGHKGSVNWGTGDTISHSLDVVSALAERYATQPDVVTILNPINEPLVGPNSLATIQQYYRDSFGRIREVNPDTVVNINDAFQGISAWQGFGTDLNNLMLGVHYYQVFSENQINETPAQHIQEACGGRAQLASADKWTVVSEWSGAITDCAKYLNGRYVGARYDGTFPGSNFVGNCTGKDSGSVYALSADDKSNIRHFIEAQLDTFEARTGWFYWTWKTEGAPEWDMQAQIAAGLFPQPIDSRQFPGQCG